MSILALLLLRLLLCVVVLLSTANDHIIAAVSYSLELMRIMLYCASTCIQRLRKHTVCDGSQCTCVLSGPQLRNNCGPENAAASLRTHYIVDALNMR
jgi:hypothetical protein